MTRAAKVAFPRAAKISRSPGQRELDVQLIRRAAKLYEAAGDWDSVRPHARESEVLNADVKDYLFVVLRNGMRDVLGLYSVWTKSAKPKLQRVGRFSAYPPELRRELAEVALWELDHLPRLGRTL